MWSAEGGGSVHSKNCLVSSRQHRATEVRKLPFLSSCQYTHGCYASASWAARHTTVCLDNYGSLSPCRHIEADKSNEILINIRDFNGPLVSANHFSGETKMQLRTAEQWGSCHTEHGESYTFIANYQHLLDLTNGLYLEMYRHDADETYRIKYITASVELD